MSFSFILWTLGNFFFISHDSSAPCSVIGSLFQKASERGNINERKGAEEAH